MQFKHGALFIPTLDELPGMVPVPTVHAIQALVAFISFLLTVPGEWVNGPVPPTGHYPRYKSNSALCYALTLVAFVVLGGT